MSKRELRGRRATGKTMGGRRSMWRDGRVMCEEDVRRTCVMTSNRFQMLEDMDDDEDDTFSWRTPS